MQTRTYWKNQNMTYRDEVFGPAEGVSLWQTCPMVAQLDPSIAHIFFDDFFKQDSTKSSPVTPYTIVEDDGAGGTDAIQDAAGGVYKHFCDGDDNDEAYMSTTREPWKFAAGKSLWFEARIAITQGAVNKANWIVGLTDAAGADMLLDDGAGPAASYDGAVFFGTEGALTFGFETSNSGTQSTTASAGTIVSGTMIRLGFWFNSESSSDTTGTITPYVDGVAGTAHTITLAGLEEMEFTIGVKSDGSAEEAFSIDYLKIVQIR